MRRTYFLLLLYAFSHWQSKAQSKHPDGSGSEPKTYAVVIGISSYQSPAVPALQYADKDARLFAAFLQSKAGGNLPESQLKVLTNGQATLAAVYDALDWLKRVCRENDLAYVYFSGHGDLEVENKKTEGFLLAYNSPPNNYVNNAIRVEALNETANYLSVKQKANVVLITDACHSGKLAGNFFKGKQLVGEGLRRVLNNEVRLTSCDSGQLALEGTDWGGGHGVFSYYLVRGMNGFAARDDKGGIRLGSMAGFLSASFKSDPFLAAQKSKQTPVTDGNPTFALATVDDTTFAAYKASLEKATAGGSRLPPGLAAFRPAAVQPVDNFFSAMENLVLENYIDFQSLAGVRPADVPLKILDLYRQFEDSVSAQFANDFQSMRTDPLLWTDTMEIKKGYGIGLFGDAGIISALRNSSRDSFFAEEFNRRFIHYVQGRAQRMILAYIEGDAAELEKRQYYSSGKRNYNDFLSLLNVAVNLTPADNELAHVLQVDRLYLTGLVARLNMATAGEAETDSLLKVAFICQSAALKAEPLAAYVLNELGNLTLRQKDFSAASAYFRRAADAAPTWAIPWSNLVRLHTAMENWKEAQKAADRADSLQPNLSYVFMNRGLLYERARDWLGAETSYLRAIRLNDVHFFPYERLAGLYLNTGRFADADYYYFLTDTRKRDFALNDTYFHFGVEQGGMPHGEAWPGEVADCVGDVPDGNGRLQPFVQLLRGLQQLHRQATPDSGLTLLQTALQKVPGLPLARHYIGAEYFRQGRWGEAEKTLRQALSDYSDEPALRLKLRALLYGRQAPRDTCLLSFLAQYRYDVLEDRYLLGAVYEKQLRYQQAADQYRAIMAVENQRQMAQAKLGKLASLLSAVFSQGIPQERLDYAIGQTTAEAQLPVTMGGAFKLARLYESRGKPLLAERVLLQQAALNRAAASARKLAMERSPYKQVRIDMGLSAWVFFLRINAVLENETNAFYKRMTAAFPRDSRWYEKGGLFLYNRMKTAYETIPVNEYKFFTETFDKYTYPWTGELKKDRPDSSFVLPGTGEKLTVENLADHPLKLALQDLSAAIRFSGEAEPRTEVRLALADVHNWYGNADTAISLMKEEVKKAPANAGLRNKLIETMVYNGNLTEARDQLRILYEQKALHKEQVLQAAEFGIAAGNFSWATGLWNQYRPANEGERFHKTWQLMVADWLRGKPQEALKTSFSLLPQKGKAGVPDDDEARERVYLTFYATARLHALLKQNEKALSALEKAMEAGFPYSRLLANDPAWNDLKNTPAWKALSERSNAGAVDYMERTDPNNMRYFRDFHRYISQPFFELFF